MTNPPAAGIQPTWPASSARSMAGMSSDHTDAAIMTPAANPRNARWIAMLLRLRNRNTEAAPSVVIRNVNPVPDAAQRSAVCMSALLSYRSPAAGAQQQAPSSSRHQV